MLILPLDSFVSRIAFQKHLAILQVVSLSLELFTYFFWFLTPKKSLLDLLATTTGACQLVPAKTFSFPHLVVGLDEQACLRWSHLALSILTVDYRYWMLQLLYSQVLKCLTSEQHMTLALVTSYFVNKNKMTDGRKSCQLCLQLYYRKFFSEFFENSNGQKYIAWKKISMKSNSKWTLIHSKIIFNFCLFVHCQIVYGQNGTKVWTVNFFFRSARASYRAFDFHLSTCPVRSNFPFSFFF